MTNRRPGTQLFVLLCFVQPCQAASSDLQMQLDKMMPKFDHPLYNVVRWFVPDFFGTGSPQNAGAIKTRLHLRKNAKKKDKMTRQIKKKRTPAAKLRRRIWPLNADPKAEVTRERSPIYVHPLLVVLEVQLPHRESDGTTQIGMKMQTQNLA